MYVAQQLGLDFLRSDIGGAIFGTLLVGGYFSIAVPFYWWKRKTSETIQKLGAVRYGIVAFLFLTMNGVMIKMLLRRTLNIKYIVKYPWINLNI